MSEILYLKFEKNTKTYNKTISLGEAGEMQCADSAILNRLKTEKLHTFQNVRKGKHVCADRKVFSIMEVVEKVHKVYPAIPIWRFKIWENRILLWNTPQSPRSGRP